jgi:predicted nuclease of predicted toxin-antitoxin system
MAVHFFNFSFFTYHFSMLYLHSDLNYSAMIQRIQTLYLSLAFIAIALLFAFPLAQFFAENGAYIFSITGLKNMVPGDPDAFNYIIFLPLIIVTAGLDLLTLFTIFQFKSRSYQIKLTNIGVLAAIVLIMGIFFLYIPMIEKKISIVPDYSKAFGIYLPLVALVFMVMANRAIKRDERLVRSADRLR